MIEALLVATLAAPAIFLAAGFVGSWRTRALVWQFLAPAPALAAGVFGLSHAPVSVDFRGLGLSLTLDPPGALLLAFAALLWMAVTAALWRDGAPDARFGISWILTMFGGLGVFIAGDLVSFYLLYALVSVPAYGLFAFSEDAEKRRAGAIYMAFALFGEALLLMAFALLAAGEPHGSVRIADVMAALPVSPWRDAIIALIVAGFGMKLGLVPFNGWMPLNYAAAPIPAAAVLSGAGVKAGVIGLIRFLPLDVAMESWGNALAALGFFTAFYGAAIGLTQQKPKTILAYSSISQMGVIAAALGLGLAAGDAGASGTMAFYGANHLLVKAALFLTLGFVASGARLSGLSLALAAALALSLAGLPFTGGALAKLASKAQFATGWPALLATLSSIASAMLMTHFLMSLTALPADAAQEARRETPAVLIRFWPALVLGALLLPWFFADAPGDALSLGKIWEGFWPVAVGVVAVFGWRRMGRSAPVVPAGDAIVLYECAFARTIALGPVFETADARLRQWPAAAASLLLIVLALLVAASI
ncbi:proton-conducting transporter membrane subunit [Rhodoblastus sp.]|uniref:proton-conducting transporter transmembrane domain-containing protein n=1 Tax=Rhodoblastus sp. TaxID=1962975 RepID=UPI002613FC8E|nr:proton-conducting transporter membrane subunit [Rhodoblastus sp.]